MAKLLKPDICVIGAGSGGLTVAAAAASFGVPVVLIEKGRMGGDCLNYGCVPSKALIAAAGHAEAARHSALFGLRGGDAEVDFRQVHRHVQDTIEAIQPNDSVERFTALGVRVIQAGARFLDRRTVAAGEFEIRARRFVLATGSCPLIPEIEGLDGVDYLTNETVFERTRRPGRLLVLGAGPVGVELAQAHRRLGSEVALVEAGTILAREDPEAAAIVRTRLEAEGVELCEGTRVVRVEKRARGVRLRLAAETGEMSIDGTHLLLAAGRRPDFGGLDLAKAGIRMNGERLALNSRLRTSNRRVYAIGDAAGGQQFTHVASYHAGLVLRSILFRLPARTGNTPVPRVTFCQPELAQVGQTEEEARAARRPLRILRWPYAENDRAQTDRKTEGFIKVVADHRGRVLGVTIVGASAGELIAMWTLAVAKRMRVHDIAALTLPYPTLSEIGKRAAVAYFADQTRRPLVRQLLAFLRLFG